MRSLVYFGLALPVVTFAACVAVAADASDDFYSQFVVGHYELIGKRPDGTATYQGQVSIFRGQKSLGVRRTINGQVVEGSAAFEAAPRAETRVLRMRFTDRGTSYECTCLVQGDLDNYARLTCHRYRQDGGTRQPGLEALFPTGADRW